MVASLLEAVALASSCSLDAFTASFAYGSSKIKIPLLSNQIINLICSAVLGTSLWIGTVVRQYLPGWLTTAICFGILFILGVAKLLDSVTKTLIRRYAGLSKEIKFSMFNLKFILSLYADPEEADVDASKVISPGEAAMLAASLSLDGMAVGFGAALGNINATAVFLTSLVTGMAAVTTGCYIGNRAARQLPFNLSWLSGAVLIGLAVIKLF